MRKLLKQIFRRPANANNRRFQAARNSRLEMDWIVDPLTCNEELRSDLRLLKLRSRDLAKNNSTYIKWLKMRETNIIGNAGIRLMMRVKNVDGEPDTKANDQIEQHWHIWGKRRNKYCAYKQNLSWLDLLGLVDRTLAVDGECFVRKVYNANNPYSYSLQIIDSMEIDIDYNLDNYHGNQIFMGIELAHDGEVLAYHRKLSPGGVGVRHERIPATDVYHIFQVSFAGQLRGYPLSSGAILDLNMADKYEETCLVGARVSASHMGFITDNNGTGTTVDPTGKAKQQELPRLSMEPGVLLELPSGRGLVTHSPQQPVSAFAPFMKSIGRSVSQGLTVAYNNLFEDLEGLSFSALRAGAIAERDMWKMAQRFMIEAFIEPVFADWLRMLLLSGLTDLPQDKYRKFLADHWQPRRWDWVDPLKDANANAKKLELQVTSRRRICSEIGLDFDDVIAELEQEKKLLAQYGLTPELFNEKLLNKAGANNDTKK
ncbi:phage portal protein [Lentisphaerota bacterium ZTH]|nr:phage portal protein [Lentisphaerota bacterium]WET05817.1 phage portal protein [Lentisphaerota bacterium ZTH]